MKHTSHEICGGQVEVVAETEEGMKMWCGYIDIDAKIAKSDKIHP